jgi:hypothetical protein
MIMNDDHTWRSYMMIIYDDYIYDDHVWWYIVYIVYELYVYIYIYTDMHIYIYILQYIYIYIYVYIQIQTRTQIQIYMQIQEFLNLQTGCLLPWRGNICMLVVSCWWIRKFADWLPVVWVDAATDTNTDTGNQSATSNLRRKLLGCFAGIIFRDVRGRLGCVNLSSLMSNTWSRASGDQLFVEKKMFPDRQEMF